MGPLRYAVVPNPLMPTSVDFDRSAFAGALDMDLTSRVDCVVLAPNPGFSRARDDSCDPTSAGDSAVMDGIDPVADLGPAWKSTEWIERPVDAPVEKSLNKIRILVFWVRSCEVHMCSLDWMVD